MIFLNYFIAIFHIFSFAHGVRHIYIGGIFTEENSDSEIAFRNALLQENMNNNPFEFTPLVHRVDPNDGYGAEKIACELASVGVVAIFGPNSFKISKIVGSVCNELGIPHIVAHWRPEDEPGAAVRHSYTRNFFPSNNQYAKALAQIIDDYEWKGFTLLYDQKESFERLKDVLEKHEPNGKPITIHRLRDEDDNYQQILKVVERLQESQLVIDCSVNNVKKIFTQAFGVKMMEEYQNYIVTSLDAHLLNYTEWPFFRANITAIRLMDPLSEEVTNALNHWQQNGKRRKEFKDVVADQIKTETALFYDAVQTFLLAFRQLNVTRSIVPEHLQCTQPTKWTDGEELLKKLTQINNQGLTGRIVFDKDGNRDDFYMEVLELNTKGFKKIAVLDPKTMNINYTRTSEEIYSQVAQSLKNKTFTVASILAAPFLKLRKSEDGEIFEGNQRYEGYTKDLMDTISKTIGFSYVLVLVEDKKQGSYDATTKKWNGLVKLLLDRKADLAICDLTITSERRSAVDFTMPFMTLGISILFAKPPKAEKDMFKFMSPLSMNVWFFMATSYLCISVLLYFLAKTAADDWENPHPCNADPDELETIWNMHNCIWLTAGSIMQQGCDILPKALSTRLTAGLWWFFALIVISSYTANLAAFLTMERMESSITSAEDLALQSSIKYGGVKGGSTLAFFQKSNVSTYQRMWASMEGAEPSVFVQDNQEGVDRVERGNGFYAFLMESTMIEFHCNRNCNLTQVGGLLDSKGYGIAMPVNSPYRTHISRTVLELQENGLLQRLKHRWWKENNKRINPEGECEEDQDGETDTLKMSMDNVGGVFIVLASGLGVSIIIEILEFLWNVSKVSVEEKITRWEAFKSELLFALDIRITTKPVNKAPPSEKSCSVSNRSSKSLEADQAIVPGWKFNLEEKQRNNV